MTIKEVKRAWPILVAAFLMLTSNLRAGDWSTVKFTGKVTDAQGRPLNGVELQINRVSNADIGGEEVIRKDAELHYLYSLKTQSQADGSFILPLILRAGDENITAELWFTKAGFVRESKEIRMKPDSLAAPPLEVTLQPGLILSGKVDVPARQEVGVLRVTGKNFENDYVTDENHRFEFYVPAGRYWIDVTTEFMELDGVEAGTTNLLLKAIWTQESVGKAFDEFWDAMDRQYSYFFIKTNVNWAAMREIYRPKALQTTNAQGFAEVLRAMLNPLRDIHCSVLGPQGFVPGFGSSYAYNGNGDVTFGDLVDVKRVENFAIVGKTKRDGFGYFLLVNQERATDDNVQQAIDAIRALHDTPGFVVDLRSANGGSEPLAARIAALFCAKETVYAKSKFRDGPGHNDFTKDFERTLPAATNAYSNPVVCLMGGGAVSSGEGFVQMMKCLPQVTTVGLPTRGASGNPKSMPLRGMMVHVQFSQWVDMMPDGEVFEGKGIQPEVLVDAPWSAYDKADPTLEKGLEILRKKVAAKKSANP